MAPAIKRYSRPPRKRHAFLCPISHTARLSPVYRSRRRRCSRIGGYACDLCLSCRRFLRAELGTETVNTRPSHSCNEKKSTARVTNMQSPIFPAKTDNNSVVSGGCHPPATEEISYTP